MAESLGAAWKELNRQLELRGYILFDAHHLHELADEHERRVKETNAMLREAMDTQEGGGGGRVGEEIVGAVAKSIDGECCWGFCGGRKNSKRSRLDSDRGEIVDMRDIRLNYGI